MNKIENPVLPIVGYVHNVHDGRNYGLSHVVIKDSGHRASPTEPTAGEFVVACGYGVGSIKTLNSGVLPEPVQHLCKRCTWVVEQRRVRVPQREARIVNEDSTIGWVEKVHGYDPRRMVWLVEDEGGEYFEVEPAGGTLELSWGGEVEPVRRRDDLETVSQWFQEISNV